MFGFKIDENIHLRLLELRHAEDLLSLLDRDREYFLRWLPDAGTLKNLDDANRAIKKWLEGFANNTCLETGIWFQDRLIGNIGLDEIDWYQKTSSLAYYLAADCQGQAL